MQLEILADDDAVAVRGAEVIAAAARQAIAERGRFVLAISGGRTPWQMFKELAGQDLAWANICLFQVDERIAPAGDRDRNLTQLQQTLAGLPAVQEMRVYPMPVEHGDLPTAAARYAHDLESLAGAPPVFDLVHLGLGPDGHTASLVPDDDVLNVTDAEVALTSTFYQGHRRMTLTYPVINRARQILWLVTGESKRPMLARLVAGDATIPAGRVRREAALILADRAAAQGVNSTR